MIAVTGGTGFFGRHIVTALVDSGAAVRLLARRAPPGPHPAELVLGDLADDDTLARLVRGAAVVVHAAGLVQARDAAAFATVNRDGTARLAAIMAREAPAARLVLVSSMAARAPALSAYAASKRAGEAAAIAGLDGAPWVILRPGVIYGPGDIAGRQMLRLAAGRFVPVPRRPEPRIAMIHASDAAAAVVAMCRATTTGVTYELADACIAGHAWRDIVRACAPGRTPRFVTVPDAVIHAAAAAQAAWSQVTRRPAIFGPGKAREILHRDWSSDPARQPPTDLWRPRIGLAEGMRETLDSWH